MNASSALPGDPMPEILTESFCERCGTRYTFESSAPRGPRLRGLRVMSRGLRNFVMSDDASMDEAMAAARNETDREVTSQQLEAFHKTFNFCMSCRQYTCSNCWNDADGRCLSCAPVFGDDGVSFRLPTVGAGGALTLTGPEAVELKDRNGHGTVSPERMTWPTADLMRDPEPPAVEGWPSTDFGSELSATEDAEETADLAAAEDAGRRHGAPGDEALSGEAPPDLAPAEREAEVIAASLEPPAETEPPSAEPVLEDLEPEPVATGHESEPATLSEVYAEADIVSEIAHATDDEPVTVGFEGSRDDAEAVSDVDPVQEAEATGDFAPLPHLETTDELEGPADLEPIDFAARFGTITGTAPEAIREPAAEMDVEPAPAPPEPADDVGATAAANTMDLLRRFRVDEDVAATEQVAEPEPEPVEAFEPEPEPEPVVAEPEPEPVAPREDVVAQPTWQIVAPDTPVADGFRPPASPEPPVSPPTDPVGATASPEAPSTPGWPPPQEPPTVPSQPEWPAAPQWPDRERTAGPGLPFLDRPPAATGGIEAVWAESTRELASVGSATGTRSGIQPCVNCGLALSANARFCRRCGTRQA